MSVWHNSLGNDQDQITWETIPGNIEFTYEYKRAINEIKDRSQGWFPFSAGLRKRFFTKATGWAFSGTIQVEASSSSDFLSVTTDTFLDNHRPQQAPKTINFWNVQCNITPLSEIDTTSAHSEIFPVEIRGFLQTKQTEILPLRKWLQSFNFIDEACLHPLDGGLGDDAEFQATRSETESTASPWFTIYKAGIYKTKLTSRKSTAPKASDGRMRAYSRCAQLLF